MNTNLNLKAKINNIVFQKISICAGLESKIALVGENGSGKITLVKLLTRDLHLTSKTSR